MKNRLYILLGVSILFGHLIHNLFFTGNYTTISHPFTHDEISISLADGGAISGDWQFVYLGKVSNNYESYFNTELFNVQGSFNIGIDSTKFVIYCPDCKFTYNGSTNVIYVNNVDDFNTRTIKSIYP